MSEQEAVAAWHGHVDRQRAAWRAVVAARTAGTLIKPKACERCGAAPRPKSLHAHHRDYSRPLDVAWLCTGCHNTTHKEEGYYERGFKR